MNQPTLDDVRAAVKQLAFSGRGQKTLRAIHAWLLDGGMALDEQNQQAVITLLLAAWGPKCGSARDIMAETVEAHSNG